MQNLVERRDRLLRRLADIGYFIKGSITCVCGACGRAHCICTSKYRTKVYRLTYKDGQQKTQIVYIPRKKLPEMKQLISNYTQIRVIIQKIIQTNIDIFKKG